MTFRVATYNLFEGAASSYNRLIEFVHETKLDVLCLQEVNGWQNNDFARLKDFTDRVLFAGFAFGNSNTEYKLATASKQAVLSQNLHAEAFWHAALEAHIKAGDQEIVVVNLHLDPWQERSRVAEIKRLIAALDLNRPTIITGDFNSLSRQDTYPPDFLAQLAAKGISKFGTSALEFQVTDTLLQAGLVDVAAAAGKFDTTVPSAFSTDKDHELPVRIDYMFATKDLAAKVKDVQILKDELTDAISDHYPLLVTFDLETSGSASDAGPQTTVQPAVTPPSTPPVPAPQLPSPSPAAPLARRNQPWTPPDEPKPKTPPEQKPKKDDDGEVVMWSHDA